MAKSSATRGMTDAQYDALSQLLWTPETWWHDIPSGPREVFRRRRWLREVRAVKCGTRGHRHPGYVAATQAGLAALRAEQARRLEDRTDPRVVLASMSPVSPAARTSISARVAHGSSSFTGRARTRSQIDREISAALRHR